MSRLLLRLILSGKNSIKSTLDYCKDKKVCDENKDVLTKKLLSLSGYKVPKGANPVPIYEELVKLGNSKANTLDIESHIKMTDEFVKIISRKGSEELKAFLLYNGIFIPQYTSRLTKLRDSITKISELAENPALAPYLPIVKELAMNQVREGISTAISSPKKKSVTSKKKAVTTPKKKKM
jgi:hypothetical protein